MGEARGRAKADWVWSTVDKGRSNEMERRGEALKRIEAGQGMTREAVGRADDSLEGRRWIEQIKQRESSRVDRAEEQTAQKLGWRSGRGGGAKELGRRSRGGKSK